MAAGCTYEQALGVVPLHPMTETGVCLTTRDLVVMLRRLGCHGIWLEWSGKRLRSAQRAALVSEVLLGPRPVSMIWMQVKRARDRTQHYVYWDGINFYDPSPQRSYIEPRRFNAWSVILVRQRGRPSHEQKAPARALSGAG